MDNNLIISNLIAFFAGGVVVYITSYLKAKGTNKALKEDIAQLESSKQRIITEHAFELEEVKKAHSLDIEKRKYQYESKKEQFAMFFRLLDEFNGKTNDAFRNRFPPMLQQLLAGYMSQEQLKIEDATLKFNQDLMQLFNEFNLEQTKITTESNGVRLVASSEMDHLLDRLESAIKSANEETINMFRKMSTLDYVMDNSIIEPLQKRTSECGQKVMECRDALRQQMKKELAEI